MSVINKKQKGGGRLLIKKFVLKKNTANPFCARKRENICKI